MPSTSYNDDASGDTMTSQAATNGATMTSETSTDITEMASQSVLTSLTPAIGGGGSDVAGVWLVGEQVGWYTVIAVLSALVLVGLCFTVCRLVMKANAHEKVSEGDWQRDSLLFSRKDSVIPISLHFHPNTDDALGSCYST